MNFKAFLKKVFGTQKVEVPVVVGQPKYFIATSTFFSLETQSTYVKGMRYTIRPGNDKLLECVKHWVHQNKAQFIEANNSRIQGTGVV